MLAARCYYTLMTPVIANLGSPTQWFILIAIVLVVFGAKKLPEIARNLGRGLGEFKKARREFEEELKKTHAEDSSAPSDSADNDKPDSAA